MIYVEDLIERLACSGNYISCSLISVSFYDRDIVRSFAEQIMFGNPFTMKQRNLALKIVKKYSKVLANDLLTDIKLITDATFRMPPRVITETKTISVAKDTNGIDKIFVRFPYNSELVESFKTFRRSVPKIESNLISWNPLQKAWEFGLSEGNIAFLSSLKDIGFTVDDKFFEWSNEITKISKNIDLYVPMICYKDEKFFLKNSSPYIPEISSSNIIEALIDARRHGINCWDEMIDSYLKSGAYSSSVISFFESQLPSPNTSLSEIRELVVNSKNVLFIIPGGSEMKIVESVHNFLKNLETTSEEISVLFRLDNASGKVFNDYVKQHKLNEPITDVTKYVFISGKLPKPLIESNKYFDLVIQFGSSTVHYSLKNFIRTHHNLINVGSVQQEIIFA